MKVCFIASCALFGGAERVLLETIDVLQERGIACRVLLPGDGEFARELRSIGVPYAFIDSGSWVSWSKPSIWDRVKTGVKIATNTVRALRKIRAWQCDLIYTNTVTFCYGPIVARILNVPHIWHLHEFGAEDHGLFYKFGERFTNATMGRTSSMCIAVSEALASKYRRYIQPSKLRVVYPSMHRTSGEDSVAKDDGIASVPGSRRFRITIVGGLVEGKGQTDAAEALVHLVKSGVDAELMIVGDGDPAYRKKVEQIAASNRAEDRIQFAGRVESALPFMRASNVIVVCSRCEAFGRATIEAMLAGKAVVGARSGATPELVRDGVNGLLYETGSASDLAAKLRVLHDDSERSAELGANGRAWAVKYFTRERYAAEVMSVFSSVAPVAIARALTLTEEQAS